MSLTDWFDRWKSGYLKEHKMQSGDAGERRGGMSEARPEVVSIHLYNALDAAHKRLEHVLAMHGCTQGMDMAEWVGRQLSEARAMRLALDVWEEYNADLETLMREHGWHHGRIKLEWLREQLGRAAPRLAAPAPPPAASQQLASSPSPSPWPMPVPDAAPTAHASSDDSPKMSGGGGTFDGGGSSASYDSGGSDSSSGSSGGSD